MTQRPTTLFALVLLLLGAAACEAPSYSDEYIFSCYTDSDCKEGFVCQETLKICVKEGSTESGEDTTGEDTTPLTIPYPNAAISGSVPIGTEYPQGLAVEGGSFWVADTTANKLYELSMTTGAIENESTAPTFETSYLKDFDFVDGLLYVSYLYDLTVFNTSTGTQVNKTDPFGSGYGVTALRGNVASWESSKLKLRSTTSLTETMSYDFGTSGSCLAFQDPYLITVGDTTISGGIYSVVLEIYDINDAPSLEPIQELTLPIDTSEVIGLDVDGTTLYLAAGGSSSDGDQNKIFTITLQ